MGYYCGIDLGGTNIKAGIVDGEGKLLNKLSIKTNADRTMEAIIHDMGQLAVDAIRDAGLEIKDIEAIGNSATHPFSGFFDGAGHVIKNINVKGLNEEAVVAAEAADFGDGSCGC